MIDSRVIAKLIAALAVSLVLVHRAVALQWSDDPREEAVRAAYIAEMLAERMNALTVGGTSVVGRAFHGAGGPVMTASNILYQLRKYYREPELLAGFENMLFWGDKMGQMYGGWLIDPDYDAVQSRMDLLMCGMWCIPASVGISATQDVATMYRKLQGVNPGKDGWQEFAPTAYNNFPYGSYEIPDFADRSRAWLAIRAWPSWVLYPENARDYFTQIQTGNPSAPFVPYPNGSSYFVSPEPAAWLHRGAPAIFSHASRWGIELDTIAYGGTNWSGWAAVGYNWATPSYLLDQLTVRPHTPVAHAGSYAIDGLVIRSNYPSFYKRIVSRTVDVQRWRKLREFLSMMYIIPLDYYIAINHQYPDYWPGGSIVEPCDDSSYLVDTFALPINSYGAGSVNAAFTNYGPYAFDLLSSLPQTVLTPAARVPYAEYAADVEDLRMVRPGKAARSEYEGTDPTHAMWPYDPPYPGQLDDNGHIVWDEINEAGLWFTRNSSYGDAVFAACGYYNNLTASHVTVGGKFNVDITSNLDFTNRIALCEGANHFGESYVTNITGTNAHSVQVRGYAFDTKVKMGNETNCVNTPLPAYAAIEVQFYLNFSNAWAIMDFDYK